MKRFLPILMLLLVSCRQEITSNVSSPVYTLPPPPVPSVTLTQTWVPNPTPTMVPPTSTLVSFPLPGPIPMGPVGIITIGDDLTFGDGDELVKGYPNRLTDKIILIRPDLTMSNFSQTGWNSEMVINGTDERFGQLPLAIDEVRVIRSHDRSAVVLLWIGNNDIWKLYETGTSVTSEQEQQDVKRFEDNMTSILVSLRTEGAEVIVALLDDQSKRPAVISGEAYPNITPEELPRMSAQVQRYNEVIKAAANQYGATTVDFFNTNIFSDPSTISTDGIHPNQLGYDQITDKWYEVLVPLLNPG